MKISKSNIDYNKKSFLDFSMVIISVTKSDRVERIDE